MKNPDAVLAFRRAAARWERVITTPITTVIDVDYGIQGFGVFFPPEVLGSSWPTGYYAQLDDLGYALVPDIVQHLKDVKPSDPQLNALYDAIPFPTHSTLQTDFGIAVGTLTNLQALGFIEAEVSANPNVNPFGSVPAIAFNSLFPFDLDPSDGIASTQYDFDAVCTHEIGHALGFFMATTFVTHLFMEEFYSPWDLFRVRPDAVEPGSLTGFATATRVNTAGPANTAVWTTENGIPYYYSTHVFFDGISEVELSTANGERTDGDGQQACHWRDDQLRPPSLGATRWIGIMDPTLSPGTRLQIKDQDLRMLEVIGYGVNYNFKYANMHILYGQDSLDLSNRTDTLKFINVDLNTQKLIPLQITNLSLDNPLLYEFEFILNDIQPSTAKITFDGKAGSIPAGQSGAVTLSILTSGSPATFLGTIRIHTNDANKLVVDIPFELTIGGATAPKINSSLSDLGNFSFDTKEDLGSKTKTFTVSNLGNLPLNVEVLITLSAKSTTPKGLLKSSAQKLNLDQFYGNAASVQTYTLYSTDFETPNNLGGFKQVYTPHDEWQQTTLGPATAGGHSKPTAVHFGKEVDGELSYDNNVNGFFYSPDFSYDIWRNTSPDDILCVSFKYFNKSEPGGDIVSFMSSKDARRTWNEIGSSRTKGILKSQSIEWETLVLQLPDITNPLLNNRYWSSFGFRFSSDISIVDQGFFLDDFEVTILKGLNPVYLQEDYAILPTVNSSKEIFLTVNGALLAPGFYNGNLSIVSNDYKNSNLTIPFTINNNLLNKATKGTLYASTVSGGSGSVLKIDPLTGKGTDVGRSGYSTLKSISLNLNTGELFGFTYSSGSTNVVKIDGLKGWGLYQFKTPVPLAAMTFTPAGDLLGIVSPLPLGKFDVPPQRLYKLDLKTGDITYLATLKTKAAAMAIEPATGDIWVTVDSTSDKDRIYKIDKANGDTTLVGRAGIGNNVIRALAFDNSGNLWGAYGEENVVSTLIKIDKSSGAASTVGTTNYRGVFGLTFSPDSITAVQPEPMKSSS
ncbi:MAG: hypothetical protein AUJ54_05775, partial [Ignavibacteria bacterium CG1_02_37_35]